MKSISKSIEKLGFDKWYLENVDPERLDEFEISRVISVHIDSYVITNGENDVLAELVGKIIYSADSPIDYPTVGDWILASYHDEGTFSVIHDILPRKSLLKRKTPGKKIDFQLIAANIDVAFIIQSLDEDFNISRLERYLVMINEDDIRPIILLSKSDLLTSDEISNKDLLELDVTVLFPSALENVITEENAQKLQCKILCELANGPTTPGADNILYDNGVVVLPDFLANAGGVTVSYFEQVQNTYNYYWDLKEVHRRLDEKMTRAFRGVHEMHLQEKVNMRQAAYLVSVARVAEACRLRGWV